MAALRDIQNKISAVKKTRQITRAMNMVAAAKLRGVQDKTEKFRPYAEKFAEVLGSLAQGINPDSHPLLAVPEAVTKVGLILISSDRGMCGSFNANLIQAGTKFVKEKKEADQEVNLYMVGKKARDYYKNREYPIAEDMPGVMNSVDFDLAVTVARLGLDAFLAGEVDEVYVLYSKFKSMAAQVPTVERLLPIQPEALEGDEGADAGQEYLTEPSAEEILVDLLPRFLNVRVYSALLETSTGENAARMTAMDNATNNCSDMIDNLTMLYNKARQAAITMELVDIIGGVEALKAG
ncbi:ATP synthase F1 subunit gamma [Dethiosulfatarculus sandiegensis]|uniref:ATP synthase gamma chain n=1 Tax=Dethiosulfatarculus sandiegensis TaxID=1429043 RepID=A0A0D2GI81_9BACT|nr:ATP synthase F1 subunit gamma [Dethiosulfatarculus sandiegensis]KIX14522.1 F0F1 ATP synthase subunit gamma [Dethiosulfatarculus sandiegensis]